MNNPSDKYSNAGDIARRWAPKIRPEKIRRLYKTEAMGIIDEELIDDVGLTLLLRCRTIWIITERRCPLCTAELHRDLSRTDGSKWSDALMICPDCGFAAPWRTYKKSYKGERIHGGRAYPAFIEFMERFSKAKTPKDKLLLIDRLIHAVHEDARQVWTTPAACNLMLGKRDEIIEFLDDLAYGDTTIPEMKSRKEAWRQKMNESEKITRQFFEEKQKRKHGEADHPD